jgi:hypothetical protein
MKEVWRITSSRKGWQDFIADIAPSDKQKAAYPHTLMQVVKLIQR